MQRLLIRQQMRMQGFRFCDDNPSTSSAGQGLREAMKLEPLLTTSVRASTTDQEQQGIENTLLDDGQFWSSSGSADGDSVEDILVYKTKLPMCSARYVAISIYRALYQHGDPIYPPKYVRFEVGPSESCLYKVSPIYPVAVTDETQVFELDSTACLCNYLVVKFYGKRQQQWEDALYYTAIRHVQAYGESLPLSKLLVLQRCCLLQPPVHSSCIAPPLDCNIKYTEEHPASIHQHTPAQVPTLSSMEYLAVRASSSSQLAQLQDVAAAVQHHASHPKPADSHADKTAGITTSIHSPSAAESDDKLTAGSAPPQEQHRRTTAIGSPAEARGGGDESARPRTSSRWGLKGLTSLLHITPGWPTYPQRPRDTQGPPPPTLMTQLSQLWALHHRTFTAFTANASDNKTPTKHTHSTPTTTTAPHPGQHQERRATNPASPPPHPYHHYPQQVPRQWGPLPDPEPPHGVPAYHAAVPSQHTQHAQHAGPPYASASSSTSRIVLHVPGMRVPCDNLLFDMASTAPAAPLPWHMMEYEEQQLY